MLQANYAFRAITWFYDIHNAIYDQFDASLLFLTLFILDGASVSFGCILMIVDCKGKIVNRCFLGAIITRKM